MRPPVRICVLLPAAGGYAQQLLQGIRAYARPDKPWRLRPLYQGVDAVPALLRDWCPAGIIAQCVSTPMRDLLLGAGLPTVNVSAALPASPFPTVIPDSAAIGAMAAAHLLERGYRHLAVYGVGDRDFLREREAAFRATVEAAGLACQRFAAFDARAGGRGRDAAATAWLYGLPRPVGVFAANHGVEVEDLCALAGIHIPDEVAVVGADYDALECDMAYPPLSCVMSSAHQVGYEAARLLDDLLAGRPAPAAPVRIAPAGVTARASTARLAIDDADVRAAVAFIEAHLDAPLTVADIVARTQVSRRTLERRFAEVRGHSLHQELLRARLRAARTLLLEGTPTTAEVARRCGFRHARYLTEVFVRELGMTPSAFRARFGGRDAGCRGD